MYRPFRGIGLEASFDTNKGGTLVGPSSNTFSNLSPVYDPSGPGGSVQAAFDAMKAKQAAEAQALINSGKVYNPGAETTPRILATAAPLQTTSFVLGGNKYTAQGTNFAPDPATSTCEQGTVRPCACATQELKNQILSQGLCKVSKDTVIKGLSATYSGEPLGPKGQKLFHWYSSKFARVQNIGNFNPCRVLTLPTCEDPCGPALVLERYGQYGYCVNPNYTGPYTAYTTYTKPYTPVYTTYTRRPADIEMATEPPKTEPPKTEPPKPGGSFFTGAWWLLLLAAAGGGYYLYSRNKKGSR